MRLKKVETGHRFKQKIILGIIGLLTGSKASDVIRTAMYRPELFGKSYGRGLNDSMRGSSDWTVAERELFAAYVSKKNQCQF
jgi:hypothetical protein